MPANSDQPLYRSLSLYIWGLHAIWTAALVLSLLSNLERNRDEVVQMAVLQARVSSQKDHLYRTWVAGHGGLYAPVTTNTPPNQYLSHVPERDITSPSGKKLTLINPAYMTRQVNELALNEFGFISHLTSLNPIRHENQADIWEEKALEALGNGASEFWSVETVSGKQHLRFMRPYITETRCLQCHQQQGHRKGDVRGGLSVSVPLEDIYPIVDKWESVLWHVTLWLLGTGIIYTGSRRLRKQLGSQVKIEVALEQSEEKYRFLAENQSDLLVKIDREGKLLYINSSYAELFANAKEEILGWHFLIPLHEDDHRSSLENFQNVFNPPYTGYREERTHTKQGWRWLAWSEKSVPDNQGEYSTVVSVGRDITDRKDSEAKIQNLAYYDQLTGLPNRSLFRDRLEQTLARASRYKNNTAILFLDLDRFKLINDSMGHSIGDELLIHVSRNLKEMVRSSDTIARLGGDEFAFVISNFSSEDELVVFSQKLLESVTVPLIINGREITTTASLGIATYPADGTNIETLLVNADHAMYQAKAQHGNCYQYYSKDIHQRIVDRLHMESNLRKALEKNELSLHYQPKIELSNRQISGMEALLRWQNEDLGNVPPLRFIPLAEESGLITSIGRWVIEEACKQNRLWQNQGLPAVPVSVNISSVQLKQPTFTKEISDILDLTGLSPQYLEIELTESTLIENYDDAVMRLNQVKQLGVKISVDDFGTGYSSLSYLKRFPVDTLKIDKSFISELTENSDDAEITKAIIALAQSLNLKVIAEGVETSEQLEFLRSERCNEVQGYFFSKPLPAKEFEVFLSTFNASRPEA